MRPALDRAGAFTLTELLVVIAIIILLIGIAVPAFSVLGGASGVEGARTQLAAQIGRARAEAISLQKPTGVLFYLDSATRRVNAALVLADQEPVTGDAADVAYFLDLVADRDALVLPTGVIAQVIDGAGLSAGQRTDDGYIGFGNGGRNNAKSAAVVTEVSYGGVILFDGSGRLVSRPFGLRTIDATGNETGMGRLLYPDGVPPVVSAVVPTATAATDALRTSVGFALFDRSTYETQFGDVAATDPQISGASYTAGTPSERDEEEWIDDNAVLLLVTRYNGTLIRGE